MILWKFLKEQNWKYAILCIIFFSCFIGYIDLYSLQTVRINGMVIRFICATGFLICYSLKFAQKYNNLFIDRLKLVFYFFYFTVYILLVKEGERDIMAGLQYALPFFLFYLYFYTALLYYKRQMEEQGKSSRKSLYLLIIVVQSILFLGIAVWAITQKVEAEKQKVLALAAKVEAEKIKEEAKKIKERAMETEQKYRTQIGSAYEEAEIAKRQAQMFQERYMEILQHKK